ncbi:hypothetical protein [Bartonella sp. CL63NXGY]|uniref:hypothetical protein n=1 Tax=Bartonella sp. CL63NXGY TaxID=3243538 RepID=UPI0035D10100
MFGGEVVKACLDVLGQNGGILGAFVLCRVWGRDESPSMMAKLPDKCFFIGEEMVLVVLLFIKKESFEGRFF